MLELKKVKNTMFDEYYEGFNGDRKVVCILDKNCVRYTVSEGFGKWGRKVGKRHCFDNGKEQKCFENATKALNK